MTSPLGYYKGADIASATTITTGSDGVYHHVTGTTTISAFSSRRAGSVVHLQFTGTLTVVHNTGTLNLLGDLDLNAVAGTMSGFISEGDGEWTELFRHRVADGGDVGVEPGGLGGPALVMPTFPTFGVPVLAATTATPITTPDRAETMPAFATEGTPALAATSATPQTSDRAETQPDFPVFNTPTVVDNGAI